MEISYRYLRFPGGKGKAVTMSYDDGCRQDIKLSNIISQYGMKCTFNLNSDKLCSNGLSREEINTYILSRGHEIAVHGAFHRAPGIHRPIEGIRDVIDCRMELEEKFDTIIRGMAYPASGIVAMTQHNSYEKIREYLTNLDIAYARTLAGDNDYFELPSDWYAWMPSAHHSNPEIFSYIDKFLNIDMSVGPIADRFPRLFYIWGHSYEFDENCNWELLETICEKIGNREDIWYATNIEIYNYVEAYNSLIYSSDSTRMYNPTLYKIWFEINGEKYVINPGETLKIA